MTRITERLPAALSERLSAASSAVYARQGREVDIAIGGIPFMLATSVDTPQMIETIPVRKDQFDSENDPGEQSLTGWWRRSQSSWHEGAGSLYQEKTSQDTITGALNAANNSFFDSSGVDVFTPGQMTLLKKMQQNGQPSGSDATRVRPFVVNSVRTNLCTEPNHETDLTGYAGTGTTPPTLTRTTAVFDLGTASMRVDWHISGGLVGVNLPIADTNPSAPITLSARVFVPTGSPAVGFIVNGVFGEVSTVFDAWTTITFSGVANSDGSIPAAIWPHTPPTTGNQFWHDSQMAEGETTTIGSYFDGNSVGGAWSGTANKSTSTLTLNSETVSLSAVIDGDLYTAPTVDGTYVQLHNPASKTIVDGLIAGSTFYDIASDGSLYEGDIGAPGSATTWPLGAATTRLGWGKARLWVIGGRRIWQPDLSDSGGTAQDPVFVNPNQGWQYTCMAEGASAMYFGGHDGNSSAIQAITLDASGGLPSLSGATVTAALPDGELVQEIAVLAGQLIGIGTNRGFRVGQSSSNGEITYGPLLFEPDGILACTALCAQSRFFVVAFRTESGDAEAYRIDTGNPLDDGVFPYARDISCNFMGAINSLASGGPGRLAATTSDGKAWYQSLTEFVDSGFLQTGRVRYRTTEYKAFKHLGVEVAPLNGAIQIDLILEGGSSLPLGSITKQGQTFTDSFGIRVDRMKYASVKFTLTPGESGAPVINSYLLRALPAVAPQRMITLPLLCFDAETAISGQRYGGQGYARDRLLALQLLEDTADSVIYQNFALVADDGQEVVIEAVQFAQRSPARPYKAEDTGGILTVQLRTLGA